MAEIDPRKIIEAIRMQSVLGQSQNQVPEEPTPTFQSQTVGRVIDDTRDSQTTPEDLMNFVNRVYKPEYGDRDTLRALLDSVPQREPPSFARKLVASGATLKAQDPIGTADKILNAPYNQSVADWKEQVTPRYQLAQLENLGNANERALAGNVAAATVNLEKSRVTEQKNRDTAEIARKKNEIAAAVANGATFYSRGNTTLVQFKDGTVYDSGVDPKNFSPIEIANIQAAAGVKRAGISADATVQAANIGATSRQNVAETGAASREIYNIPNPTDNGATQIAVRINPITHKVERVTLDDQAVGPAMKPPSTGGKGTDITNATKTMMEGAKMLRPHIVDLNNQATDLEKRGLFGPVMSRVRTLAAKVGTTGDADQVQKSLGDFAAALNGDPVLNASNDAAVGQFVSNLSLMASGAGRVHGGARGGGSIEMIRYMNSLLNSESSLDMFLGRMKTLDDYMKGYEAGPGGSAVTNTTTKTPTYDEIMKKYGGK